MKTLMRMILCFGLSSAIWAALEAAPYTGSQPRKKAVLGGHDYLVSDLAFSPDGKMLASADGGKKGIRLWDVASGKLLGLLPDEGVRHIRFSPDGKIVATAGKGINLWDTSSRKNIATLKDESRAQWMLFSSDSKQLSAIGQQSLTVWSIEKKKELRSRRFLSYFRQVSGPDSIERPLFAAYNPRRGEPPTLRDAFTGEEVVVCRNPNRLLSNFALDPQEKIVAAALSDSKVHLWDRGTGKEISTFEHDPGEVCDLTFSPDGKILAMYMLIHPRAGGRSESGIRFHEMPSGRLLWTQAQSGFNFRAIHGLAFSPDGRLFATVLDKSVQLWSVPAAWRKKK
jgi:WD40 repeat protein